MSISNYPGGFAGGVNIRGLTVLSSYSNKTFWVDSVNGSDGNKGTFDRPFATIDFAVGNCTADRGDIIFVKAGHVETVTAAAGLALDVAGISLIGFGNSRNRPQINFTTATTASMLVTAANISMQNFRFTGGIDALTRPINVNAADFTLTDWSWTDVTGEATIVVLTNASANRMELANFEYDGATTAGTTEAISIVGGDNIKIHDFIADGNFSVGFINVKTTATTDLKVWNVVSFRTRNSADIFIVDTITASTGTIGPNLNLRLQDNAANITEACTGATFVYFQPINIVNLAGESSMQTNITASTDA